MCKYVRRFYEDNLRFQTSKLVMLTGYVPRLQLTLTLVQNSLWLLLLSHCNLKEKHYTEKDKKGGLHTKRLPLLKVSPDMINSNCYKTTEASF